MPPRFGGNLRVAARLGRQRLLSRFPPVGFTFFVHESVLRLPLGGCLVMSDQLHHLLRISVRTNVSLRIVPTAIGGHPGLAGQFELMEFATFKPVAYLDSETSSLFLEEHAETTAYKRVLAGLADKALDEGQSRQFIATLATALYPLGDEHDEQT